MQITSEQSSTKLRILPRDMAEMTDDEITQFLEAVIRPERGKAIKSKSVKQTKAAASKTEVDVDDLA